MLRTKNGGRRPPVHPPATGDNIIRPVFDGRIKREITQNLGKQKLRFMCTALPLDEIYPSKKFHNHSLFSLRDMHWKKSKYKKKITKKLSKQELRFISTVLPLDKIYPPTKFHNHSKYSFRDMHQTKL